jgi:signal transduction histidine kinase
MPAVIERYLADDEERRRIARQGHEFVMRDLTMTACTARLLELLAKARPPRY